VIFWRLWSVLCEAVPHIQFHFLLPSCMTKVFIQVPSYGVFCNVAACSHLISMCVCWLGRREGNCSLLLHSWKVVIVFPLLLVCLPESIIFSPLICQVDTSHDPCVVHDTFCFCV
jgi:hypothetical protein